MIPESKLTEIIGRYLVEELGYDSGAGGEKLARYITVNTLKVLHEENAPESALLMASCVLLTSYIEKNQGIELLENGPGVIACFPMVEPAQAGEYTQVEGVMCPNVAQALITMASRLYSE